MRNTARRSGGQYGRRRDEEYGRDEGDPNQGAGRGPNTDSLIADMAKGFVEAQAKIASAPDGGPNQEMLAMLEKISRQLSQMQNMPAGVLQTCGQGQAGQQTQGAGQGKEGRQEELSTIFSRLLTENKADGQQNGSQQGSGTQQRAGGMQSVGGSGQQSVQNSGKQTGGQAAGGAKPSPAQTAAQALAQAQYELANELEASLAKLKQVISESEKLADKISNLLGQESGSRQT
jgi:hypothetical protein